MDPHALEALLRDVARGGTTVDAAIERLRGLPFGEDEGLTIDHHRALRTGLVEVVYGESKTADEIARALAAIRAQGQPALATRVSAEKAATLEGTYDARSRTLRLGPPAPPIGATVAVVCAGTSDLAVAEEAAIALAFFGAEVRRIHDVGVAGLQRILAHREALAEASAVVVVAGMDGALPSVVGGLVGTPVIAVPTSVGYGASFGGLAALLAMLGSCAPGVVVTNIDNGYGAAAAALRILGA